MEKIISRSIDNSYIEIEVGKDFIVKFISNENEIVDITKYVADLALDGYFDKLKSKKSILNDDKSDDVEIGKFEFLGIIKITIFKNNTIFELSNNQFIEFLSIGIKNQIIIGINNG